MGVDRPQVSAHESCFLSAGLALMGRPALFSVLNVRSGQPPVVLLCERRAARV